MSLTKDVHSLNKSLRRWCGLVAISEALELVLEVHGRSAKETAGRGIRENVTKLGKRLARHFFKEGHVFLAARFELSSKMQMLPNYFPSTLAIKGRRQQILSSFLCLLETSDFPGARYF